MPLLFLAGFIFSAVFDRLLGRPVSALSFYLSATTGHCIIHAKG